MFRTKGLIVVLLVCVFCVGAGFCNDQGETKPDPLAKKSILVEAFVVRVSLDALADSGVSSIGQSPEGVSILNVLWCLSDEEEGEVVSGAKLMVGSRDEAKVENEKTFYIKTEKVVSSNSGDTSIDTVETKYDEYSVGNFFETRSFGIDSDGKSIRLSYSYSETGMDTETGASKPPIKFSYFWQGNLFVQSGKPVIAGAVQNDTDVTFCIITATIQDEEGGKTK